MKHKEDLQQIPGIGNNMERRLRRLGYTKVSDLKNQNPQEMYERDCELNKDQKVCRCVLYCYRLAVYFAENEKHDPEKLKWGNWKD
ncbi:MAG: helix-hairpin-helix domain-containing protein [Pseudomonadales bacterium]|jgi:hypothetical protein|nr:helix-hairpin-helix domain-containing protein [Pseudomonadales bacterium]